MLYEAISKHHPDTAKISVLKEVPEILCAQIETDNRKTTVKYTVEDYTRGSHLRIRCIDYENKDGGERERIMPLYEKNYPEDFLPEDFLEELSLIVKIHNTKGVYWNGLYQIKVFDEQDYPDHHLTYKVIPLLGMIPRVILHEKEGNFFFKDHDEVTYKSIPDHVVAEYISQANRLKSNVAIPDWVLIRDHSQGEIKYVRLKDCSDTPAFNTSP